MLAEAQNGLRVRWLWWAIGCSLALGCAALFLFDPARFGIYPRCLFYGLTGLHCPGCGCLRATHQLLHGHIGAAFQLNPLYVILLPLLLALGLNKASGLVRGREWVQFTFTGPLGWALFALVLLFTLLRNLPAFAWMRP